ncbi:MAG: HAD family hydrolase [Alphaproteobacteria bacterium]|nr:HAD family hydrolase [Alphaproteobacteria bacterium]
MPLNLQHLPKPELVIFDWDDTLIDNYAAIHAAINAARAAFGLPVWSLIETRENCRIALKEIFPIWFGSDWENAQTIFYETFEAQHLQLLQIKSGAEQLFQQLQRAQIPLAINSNKKACYLREEITFLQWDAYFKVSIGAGDVAAGKPAPEGVYAICRCCDVMPCDAIWFVGDNSVDLTTARNAGVTPVLIGVDHTTTADCMTFHALPNLAKYLGDFLGRS